jgi:hypothetical protein
MDDGQMEKKKLNDIFQHTRDVLGTLNMKELTQMIYSMYGEDCGYIAQARG